MRRLFILLLMVVLLLFPNTIKAFDFDINSKNVILYNLDEDTILYESGSEEVISIASMTKIMTAIVALEHIDSLDTKVVLTSADFKGLKEANASVAGFYVGETVTYRDLLHGLLLPSGADAALALARNIAGSREAFVELMNAKAKEIGLKNTSFKNETGLDADGHYSTVLEVSKLFKYALENPEFVSIIKASNYKTSNGRLNLKSTAYKYIERYNLTMDYFLGGKTGTTYDAGLCLASIASYNDVNYMLVTARAPYPSNYPYHLYDAKNIYEYYMNNFENKIVLEKGDLLLTLNTDYSEIETVSFYASEELKKYLSKEYSEEELELDYEGIEIITPVIKGGTKLGEVTVSYQEQLLDTIDIILENQISFSLIGYLEYHKETVFLICGVVIGLITLIGIIIYVTKNLKLLSGSVKIKAGK